MAGLPQAVKCITEGIGMCGGKGQLVGVLPRHLGHNTAPGRGVLTHPQL